MPSPSLPPAADPAFAEAERRNDNDIPPQDDVNLLPVVGLGGSAGSLAPLQEFFERIPPDLGIAYVVVIHLPPDHESLIAELLQVRTSMAVIQVEQPIQIQPNHVYVIPPGRHLAMQDSTLQLIEPENVRETRVAIDLFFRTLATTHRSKAVAVVLSGADSDGAIGIKRIKETGGLTIAQDPDEAEYDSMPRSAIETGLVDWILPIKDIAGQIVGWINNEEHLRLPSAEVSNVRDTEEIDEIALREVLLFLQARTGHDFSHYKRATVLRRIGRRLQVNSQPNLPQYINFLRTHPGEAGALLQDLLVSVTNFFRDPESFWALDTFIPRLFRDKNPREKVRIWVPGCATGEEAYSLAMLLEEYIQTLDAAPEVQIFATDLDEQALRVAREGIYPSTIAADVSPERLRRFFVPDQGRYRVKKELRERILFAPHNVLQDAPFSRLDLISCRNVLIYFTRAAQERVFEIFHFALRPGGLIFLGGSESADDSLLFVVQDRKHRIYVRQAVSRAPLGLPNMVLPALPRPIEITHSGRFLLDEPASTIRESARRPIPPLSYGELHLKLLEQAAPPSILLDINYDIVHLSEHAGQYLRMVGGEMSSNLLSLVHPALRVDLRVALFRAVQNGEEVSVPPIPIEIEGNTRRIRLRVRPMQTDDRQSDISNFVLVIFDEYNQAEEAFSPPSLAESNQSEVVNSLEAELHQIQNYLRASVEQYEASTEELKASNEELQAMYEEQRSAGEELEASREEIQAGNEELFTVNAELKSKIDELSRTNSDLQNLISSTTIATIFLSRDLTIKRYTPPAVELFHFIPTDMGRPLRDLKHDLGDGQFIEDAERVVRTLIPSEREVLAHDGRWFLARIAPYRTVEDRIEGVVMTFVDISQRKQVEDALRESEAALRESEERMRLLIESAIDYSIFTTNANNTIDSWSEGARRLFGWTAQEAIGQKSDILFTPEDRANGAPEREIQTAREQGRAPDERFHIRKDGSRFYVSGVVSPLYRDGVIHGFVKIARDLTEQHQQERALRESEARLQKAMEIETVGVLFFDNEGGFTGANNAFLRMIGYSRQEFDENNLSVENITLPEWMPRTQQALEELKTQGVASPYEKELIRRDGSHWWGVFAGARLGENESVEYVIDITESKHATQALQESENRFRVLTDAIPQLIWTNEAQGKANFFNNRWFEYSGLSLEESVGPGWQAIVHPDDAPASIERWRRSLETGEIFDTEYRLRRFDGIYRWHIGRNIPLRDEEGHTSGWFGSATDIEELKQAQQAVHESEERLRIAVDAGELGTWDWDVKRDEVVWNNRHFLLFGMTPRQGLGKVEDFASRLHPDDRERVMARLSESVQNATAFEAEFRIVRENDQQVRWMSGYGRITEAQDGRATRMSGVMFDSTERREAQEILRRSHEELESSVAERTRELAEALQVARIEMAQRIQLEAARAELMKRIVNTQEEERGRISRELHDNLGQHLTALLLGLQTLEDQIQEVLGGKRQKEIPQLEQLRSQVDELMRVAHRQARELRPAELDAMGLEAALEQYINDWMRSTGIPVDFQALGWEERRPNTEIETTLYRIVQEALTNVVRHANASQVSVVLELTTIQVSAIIEDNGHGFDPDQNTERLGLLGMRERLAIVGGTLDIESVSGEGTTVFARVPLPPSG